MLTQLDLDQITIIGVSVGGVYTAIHVPELSAVFDAGMAPRSFVGARYLFLSHGHADHIGALPALLGVRGLCRAPAPLTFVPEEIKGDIADGLAAFSRGQRRALELPMVGMAPSQEAALYGDLHVRCFRTIHSVVSLGYQLFRRVEKLRPEFLGLSGAEIARHKKEGRNLFHSVERLELAYVTDSLVDVLDDHPSLYESRVLILECTFVDTEKSKEESRRKYHVHLDEIIDRADRFQNQHLVLMHFSQAYRPREVREILKRRLPPQLRKRVTALCPSGGVWPG